MRISCRVGVAILAGSLVGSMVRHASSDDKAVVAPVKVIRAAIVTGGHPFDAGKFSKLFEGYSDVADKHLPQKAGGELFDNIDGWPYDVIVLYNFAQTITPKQQTNFVKLLERGVGLVILHHANDAYPNWALYHDISGVESHFGPWRQNGVQTAASGFKGGVKFNIHVADPNHPITRGLHDYDALDETYCRRTFSHENHLLLTTDEPSSDKPIGWVRTFRKSRVFYIQSGHDEQMYQNPTYREIVVRAIRWSAGQLF